MGEMNVNPDLMGCVLLCSRGAVEGIRALGGGEPGKRFSKEVFQRLTAACDTLRECASRFTKLGFKEHGVETHVEYAQGLRSVSTVCSMQIQCFVYLGSC